MKYYAPHKGEYDSGLTAKLMYNIVDGLIKRHVTVEDRDRLIKTPRLGLEKLWDKPTIRSELEEFLTSYLTTGLDPSLGGFEGIFSRDKEIRANSLQHYRSKLEQEYGSTEEATTKLRELVGELENRLKKLKKTILYDLSLFRAKNKLIQRNVADSFSQLAISYEGRIFSINRNI